MPLDINAHAHNMNKDLLTDIDMDTDTGAWSLSIRLCYKSHVHTSLKMLQSHYKSHSVVTDVYMRHATQKKSIGTKLNSVALNIF